MIILTFCFLGRLLLNEILLQEMATYFEEINLIRLSESERHCSVTLQTSTANWSYSLISKL
jgi:hypothetical protein